MEAEQQKREDQEEKINQIYEMVLEMKQKEEDRDDKLGEDGDPEPEV